MRKLTTILAGVAVAGFAWAASAATWDMPTPYGENNFHTINIKQFAADVKAATGGALEIKVHSGGSLFKHPDIKNAVRGGQVPIGEFLLSRLSNENPVFEVDGIPFLASTYTDAMKLWNAARPATEKLLDQQGLMVLYAVPWPGQDLYAKKAINKVSDLKGMKFRAYNAATERVAQLAGAIPTQIELADIAQAFATGRVEAVITSPSTGANHKFWDFLSYHYKIQGWMPKNVVVVNKRAFRRLDKKSQEALLNAAKAAQARGWKASMAEAAEKIAILKANGMKSQDPSAELVAGLKAIGKTMTEEWAQKAGADGAAILKAYHK